MYTEDTFKIPVTNIPLIHQDETAYSWYRRISLLNCGTHPIALGLRLFDARYAALSHDFPDRVRRLLQMLGEDSRDSALEFSRQHTLAGYYLPFLDADRAQLVLSYIDRGEPSDLKAHLGFLASRITASHPLKFCRACVEEELSTWGYAYWHVEDQSPSAWVCLKHDLLLEMSKNRRLPKQYRRWITPEEAPANQSPYKPRIEPNETLRRLTRFSALASQLEPGELSPDQLSATYARAMRAHGFLTDGGHLRLRRVIAFVRDIYAPCRGLPGFHILDNINDEWAGFIGLARQSTRPAHPFKHLLLISALFDRWSDFMAAYLSPEDELPVAPTSIPAAPDLRPERLRRLVEDLGLSLTAAARQVGITTTTASQWSAHLDIPYTKRTKTIDDNVLAACRALLRQGASRDKIADQLPISPTSITRLLAREPELREAWHAAIFAHRREENRAAFLVLLDENRGVPVKIIRTIPGNGYMWLYRNDRRWLTEHLPSLPEID